MLQDRGGHNLIYIQLSPVNSSQAHGKGFTQLNSRNFILMKYQYIDIRLNFNRNHQTIDEVKNGKTF